ncbi:baseplate J/gp47 family protein [Mycoavidus sp. SF9855]|uniref:baseplate J/gp47 family protein n=1 Tax=Mycoavidus sp. SF9855 TaxID=2968475 RepID=UPI00211BC6D1|nr:baseplate J/gp47 family protein [Mycoavidus sp. SF9855]UUM20889.1 baseplate J/gp47 family protein [Mycoavidus sp. SF9855]
MAQLTEQGFIIERLDANLAQLDAGFRTIYGADINTDPDSPDGQLIGLIAQIKTDLEELAESIYKALDPEAASGVWLEQRVAYAGLTRRQAHYSYLRNTVLTGAPHTLIPAGSVLTDPHHRRWLLAAHTTLNENGSAHADFRSETLGAFPLPAETKLTIETLFLGWRSAKSNQAAEVGEEEETDAEMRRRFFISRAKAAQNSVDGMIVKLLQLADVRQAVCLENDNDTPNADGVPAHSLNIIVEGGSDADIAQVIFDNKTAGTGLRGQVQCQICDNQDMARTIRFDRPAKIECAAYLEVRRNAHFTAVNIDAIKAAIAQTPFSIGEAVLLSRLYSPINTVQGFWVETLRIGRQGETLTASNIKIGVREMARFASADIEVVVL